MSARLSECLKFVLAWEGGRDDDPDDPGGRTAFGIIQREYSAWRRAHGEVAKDVWDISPDEVRAIYAQNYWIPMQCDGHTAPFDLVVFDSAVNCGNGRAVKWRTLAKAKWYLLGKRDGIPGLCRIYINMREAYYHSIGDTGRLSKFLRGWLNRTAALRKECGL